MNCGGARKLFGAYWDDEITLAERDWLESHFSACEGCRQEYEQFARSIELVSSLPRADVRPDLAERALARARRATVAADRLPHATPRWMPITATAALLAIAATMTLQWMGVTPPGKREDRSSVATVTERGPARVLPVEAEPAAAPESPGPGPAATAGALAAGATDTLFDHSADIEFILDPVMVKKGRAHTVLKLNPSVQGEKAVITF